MKHLLFVALISFLVLPGNAQEIQTGHVQISDVSQQKLIVAREQLRQVFKSKDDAKIKAGEEDYYKVCHSVMKDEHLVDTDSYYYTCHIAKAAIWKNAGTRPKGAR